MPNLGDPDIQRTSAEAAALELLAIVARAEGVNLDKEPCGWSKAKILDTYRECLGTVKSSRRWQPPLRVVEIGGA